MKIKTISIFACILVIVVGLSSGASANLTITPIRGDKQGNIFVGVINNGPDPVENVSTEISVQYGLLNKKIDIGKFIEIFPPNPDIAVYYIIPDFFGFGKISVYASVSHSLGDLSVLDDSQSAHGFIFFHNIKLNTILYTIINEN